MWTSISCPHRPTRIPETERLKSCRRPFGRSSFSRSSRRVPTPRWAPFFPAFRLTFMHKGFKTIPVMARRTLVSRSLGTLAIATLCAVFGFTTAGAVSTAPPEEADTSHQLRITPDVGARPADRAGIPPTPDAADPSAAPAGRARDEDPYPDTRGNRLTSLRDEERKRLEPAVRTEYNQMSSRVRLLDRATAYAWLDGFISSRPWNCPLETKHEWIQAIMKAADTNGLPICKEILGLTACIISIESGFRADPPAVDPSGGEDMAALLQRAEDELYRKAGPLLSIPPLPGLYGQYKQRYYQQLLACRTEGDVEAVARCIAEDLKQDVAALPHFLRKPVWEGIDRLADVVRTKGSMQLNFNRAAQVTRERGANLTDEELTEYVYTRDGGVDVGVAALKPMFVQYAARHSAGGDLSWLFLVGMDYHYGPFSSRNMMEQIRIRDLSGRKIALDGDFLHYNEEGLPMDKDSQTLKAFMSIFPHAGRDDILKCLVLEKDPHYVYTKVHRNVGQAHAQRFGPTPFAVIGELFMGEEAKIKHGMVWKTRAYLNKLDRYLNSVPWDYLPAPQ